MKQDIKLDTLLFPLPAVMVSCGATEEDYNIITLSWVGTICSNPPMCYISVKPSRHSYDIIKKNMEFVINLSPRSLAKEIDWSGTKSGRDVNKFKELGLSIGKAKAVQAPIINESPVNIECRVKEILKLGSHDMFIAEVIHIQADRSVLDEKGRVDANKVKPIAYSFREYYDLGENIGEMGWTSKLDE